MAQFHPLTIKEVRRETPDCVSVAFELPENLKEIFRYAPGQNLTFRVDLEGEDVRRTYSICSGPGEDDLRVAVKHLPGGKFSTYANTVLQAGDKLEVMPPMGNFVLHPNGKSDRAYVAFAAGSGITPIISIMKAVLQQEPRSSFTLFYGNKSVDSIIFRKDLEDLKNQFLGRLSLHHILSREKLGTPLFAGRINEEKCAAYGRIFFDPEETDAFYLCGPEQMIFTVSDALKKMGVEDSKVHYELFTTPTGKMATPKTVSEKKPYDPTKESRVTINLDGISFDIDIPYAGDAILDAALEEGADLPFACKGGVCCTCRAKLLEGKVDMDVNYALEPEEVKAGFILTCQSHPRSEKLVVDFDVR